MLKEKLKWLYRVIGGVMLMVRRKRPKDWHHRIPDFKLVYCGPKKSFRKETGKSDRRGRIQVSVTSDGKDD
jgi:hypothetical protein